MASAASAAPPQRRKPSASFCAFFAVSGIGERGLDRAADAVCGGVRERNARAERSDAVRHAVLLRRLRVEDERQTVPQSFARAVHAAVGEKDVGAVEHRHLVHARADGAVFRNGTERREVCLRAGGEHELKARIAAESGKAGTVEGERVVVDRAERDVDEGAPRQLSKDDCAGRRRGPTKWYFSEKVSAQGWKSGEV